MKVKCPFCGQGEIEAVEGGSVEDLVKPGAPSPHALYEQTGGGEPYRRAMVKHGYVLVNADVRCGAVAKEIEYLSPSCSCLLAKGHEGPHLCPHGEWE